ncbi:T9SS type A sorting domain-containing protein [Flaviaesturariibacter flavus]|uniref:T9SS type A sorting domain-containing protein n=1 Tax=Flaviaesturariibacter flavus TaxID=2502780 RepID=A0A4R1B3S8_9BACT|nr:T9SS type A sorting domain-containing protein [Flaviaesturariibacter flavus]TCJ12120.1 T9SS type A sorting domain-containing protein [Flaviaesturariibacter flavus]
MQFRFVLLCAALLGTTPSFAQVKVLFDATKAQTAGNADWVIDADLRDLGWTPNAVVGVSHTGSNAQRFPTPAQSGITATTAETYWDGALSAWGVDCVKRGYTVETLPYNGTISYGNSSNLQDLSNYKVFIIDEPNIRFTAAEKTAILQWVQAGGGLFMISDHTQSDRNNDGWDSPAIWNDFLTNNGSVSDPFGISFDLANFSQTSSNIIASASDSIIHGSMGNVTQVKWSNGTSMTLNTTANSSVKGVVYMTGSSGNTGVMLAYARYGNGKVAALGDSSPADDGTGNPACSLFNGYFSDAGGNHQRLLMNATIWLATPGITTAVTDLRPDAGIQIRPGKGSVWILASGNLPALQLYDLQGRLLAQRPRSGSSAKFDNLTPGIYILQATAGGRSCSSKVFVF